MSDAAYRIERLHEGRLVTEMDDLSHTVAKGIVEMVWGTIPTTLQTTDTPDREWKLSLGEGHWVIVRRTQ